MTVTYLICTPYKLQNLHSTIVLAQMSLVYHGLLAVQAARSHSFRHIHLRRSSLGYRSVRRRDLYPATHNTHKGQTSMPPAEFEPTIPARKWPQTHALDRAASRIVCTVGISILIPLQRTSL